MPLNWYDHIFDWLDHNGFWHVTSPEQRGSDGRIFLWPTLKEKNLFHRVLPLMYTENVTEETKMCLCSCSVFNYLKKQQKMDDMEPFYDLIPIHLITSGLAGCIRPPGLRLPLPVPEPQRHYHSALCWWYSYICNKRCVHAHHQPFHFIWHSELVNPPHSSSALSCTVTLFSSFSRAFPLGHKPLTVLPISAPSAFDGRQIWPQWVDEGPSDADPLYLLCLVVWHCAPVHQQHRC